MNHRKTLNIDQLKVLELLYKFRFGSNDLVAQYFGKRDRSFVYKRLKILLEQGLIDRRFDSSYRLLGKPAAHYLLPEGARMLQAAKSNTAINIKVTYKNKSVSEEFVGYCLALFDIYCQIRRSYGDAVHFFTRHQLAGHYDYFDDFVPGAYMRIDMEDGDKDYFIEYLQSSKPFFASVRRLKQYIEYADTGEWEAGTDCDFPKVLLVCDASSLQDRLMKRADSILDEADDELEFYITDREVNTWRNLAAPDVLLTLSQL